MSIHNIMGGKVRLYQRGSTAWHCSTYLNGKERRKSTKEDSLAHAKQLAEDWYLELRGKARAGLLKTEKTFREAAKEFESEYEVITDGQRSPLWVKGHKIRIRLHLNPFFGDLGLSEITPGKVQQYRAHRASTSTTGKAPARSTLHDEVVTLRMVLKTAIRFGWLEHLPDLSPPYGRQGKVVHRPWFSPEEYKQLYKATGEYARNPSQEKYRWNAEQVHDYVLFLGNTGLRPDEAKNSKHRDVKIVDDKETRQQILEINVRGKHGVGICKSMPGAVKPYERLRDRPLPGHQKGANPRLRKEQLPPALIPVDPQFSQPSDPVFPGNHISFLMVSSSAPN